MDAELRALIRDLIDEPVEWDCPGISTHPGRAMPNRAALAWRPQPRGRYRVVEYTCDCKAVFYELISCGGVYQIHKVVQSEPPQHAYVGGWRASEAWLWWHRLLIGAAR